MNTDRSLQLLEDLTAAQQEAVTHVDGPLLLLAAAGSGKTRVITRRVAWLMQQGVRAYNILAITFTNKAAKEMRARVDELVPGNRVWISTFHSLGARLLRQYGESLGLQPNFTIYDVDDSLKAIKNALTLCQLDSSRYTPEMIAGAISKAKNQLQTPDQYLKKHHDMFGRIVGEAYAIYQKKLRDSNALDFDDLLYIPAMGLMLNEEFRNTLNDRFRYILIDEYQDTNAAQYEIARRLSQNHRNLCVVGDPDQSIYRWRGSDIKNILDFERDFPEATTIALEKNFRSTPAILRAADALIGHNKHRKKKGLITDNDEGEPVRQLIFDNGYEEADQVVRRIKDAVTAGKYHYRDVAIFVRMNALTRVIESCFVKHAVPFQIVRGLAFFDRKENKDILAYLKLLVNPADNVAFTRIVNEPPRGIGKTTIDRLTAFAEQQEISLTESLRRLDRIPEIKGKAATTLIRFGNMMEDLRRRLDEPPETIMDAVLEVTGYREMLQKDNTEEGADRLANVEELISSARQFTSESGERSVREFLETITLASDTDNHDESADRVSVMTIHASKGLEFPVVFILAMEQGILPGERSLEKIEDLEEERRVAFVGMTRAKKELYLCMARVREFRGRTLYTIPSMFLEELPSEVIQQDCGGYGNQFPPHDMYRQGGRSSSEDWSFGRLRPNVPAPVKVPAPVVTTSEPVTSPQGYRVGQIVQHDSYGLGTISEISGHGSLQKIRIRFTTQGLKTFVASMVKLKVISK